MVTLGDVLELKYGKSLAAASRSGDGFPVYGSNGVVGSHILTVTQGPTIIVGRKGSYGEINYSSGQCWPIDTTYYIDETCTSADLRWLAHLLPTLGLNRMNKSAAIPGLSREDAYRVPIWLPPMDEQRRIATILDKADELRAKRRQALAHLDTLTQSIFHSMFRDASATSLLSDAVTSLVGGKNLIGADDTSNPYRVLKISAVTSGRYLESESKPLPDAYKPLEDHIVKAGDVIISRANTTELVGASALVASTNGFSVLPDKLWRAVPSSNADPRFLLATLQSAALRAEMSRRSTGSGGSMKNISKPKLLSIPIALPPLELQQTFATRVAAVERLKESHRKHLAEVDALFASLQHRAFKGEL